MNARPTRGIAWSKDDPLGAEFVEVRLGPDDLVARGVAIGSAPVPYRLDYELETAARFVTARFAATVCGNGWTRTLDLVRDPSGVWKETARDGGDRPAPVSRVSTDVGALAGALDVDLGLSPFFNTMPVLRHGLLRQRGAIDFVMAWVSVPDLAVHRSLQRYSLVEELDDGRSVVLFESLGGDGFAAEIEYDAEGLVLDYPSVATRIR
jgi:uncharacterized protein